MGERVERDEEGHQRRNIVFGQGRRGGEIKDGGRLRQEQIPNQHRPDQRTIHREPAEQRHNDQREAGEGEEGNGVGHGRALSLAQSLARFPA